VPSLGLQRREEKIIETDGDAILRVAEGFDYRAIPNLSDSMDGPRA
jgi:hypothetical protein